MNAYLLGILFGLACFGVFYILDRIGRPLLRGLLNGPLNGFYLDYLRSSTKYEFDLASAANNSDRAWSSLVFEKVYQIGVLGVSYSRRERNLEYIKAEALSRPHFSRKIADELIKVLPKQYGNLDFQKKLACYICELLSLKTDSSMKDKKNKALRPIHSVALDRLTTAISAWIAGALYLLLSLYVLDRYQPVLVVVSSFLLFILMVIPLFNLVGTWVVKITGAGTIATSIIIFLGVFATIAHGRTQLPLEVNLDQYQNPETVLTIRSPEWLTMNNTECNGKKISVSVVGKLTALVRFRVNDHRFYFTNKDCVEIIPQIEINQSEIQAYEFYIASRDSSPFFSQTASIKIVPFFVLNSEEVDFNSDDFVTMKLENWFWNLVSNLYIAGGSFGCTILLYLLNYFVNKKRL
ncbi:MAG: hypothetical protein IT313_09975 [Anaerolineales bacterium]|nr:hypothetical protein [Anaerolineales bacterium]